MESGFGARHPHALHLSLSRLLPLPLPSRRILRNLTARRFYRFKINDKCSNCGNARVCKMGIDPVKHRTAPNASAVATVSMNARQALSKAVSVSSLQRKSHKVLNRIRPEESTAYPGWKICEADFQNKGYGPKIIIMLFDFLFTDKEINSPHELERIVWDTMLENTRAQHVYENKIGAKKTKIVENSWQDQTGTWRTAIYYEITRETFYSLHF